MKEPILVPEGDAVGFTCKWSELLTTGPEDPTSVTYQVFDRRTGSAVSGVQTVADPAAEMSFAIPAAHLPAGAVLPHSQRQLVVQVVGHFNSESHTEEVALAIHKGY